MVSCLMQDEELLVSYQNQFTGIYVLNPLFI
jgi:hypothetical protein